MRKSLAIFLLGAVAAIVAGGSATADTITFSAPDITLSESNSVQTGYFDITISDTASSNHNLNAGGTMTSTGGSDGISADTVEVVTQGGNGGGANNVTFPNSDDQTQLATVGGSYTYLFSTESLVDPSFNGSNTNFQTNNQDVWLNDASSGSARTLSAGTPLGLLRVEYSIPANFTGTADITLTHQQTAAKFGSIPMATSAPR